VSAGVCIWLDAEQGANFLAARTNPPTSGRWKPWRALERSTAGLPRAQNPRDLARSGCVSTVSPRTSCPYEDDRQGELLRGHYNRVRSGSQEAPCEGSGPTSPGTFTRHLLTTGSTLGDTSHGGAGFQSAVFLFCAPSLVTVLQPGAYAAQAKSIGSAVQYSTRAHHETRTSLQAAWAPTLRLRRPDQPEFIKRPKEVLSHAFGRSCRKHPKILNNGYYSSA